MAPKTKKTEVKETVEKPTDNKEAEVKQTGPNKKLVLMPPTTEIHGDKILSYTPRASLTIDIYHYPVFDLYTLVCRLDDEILAVVPGIHKEKLLTGSVISEIFLRLMFKSDDKMISQIASKLTDFFVEASTWLGFHPTAYFVFDTKMLYAEMGDSVKYPILLNEEVVPFSLTSPNKHLRFHPALENLIEYNRLEKYYAYHRMFFELLRDKLRGKVPDSSAAFTSSKLW